MTFFAAGSTRLISNYSLDPDCLLITELVGTNDLTITIKQTLHKTSTLPQRDEGNFT
jgi:hypothetical protein